MSLAPLPSYLSYLVANLCNTRLRQTQHPSSRLDHRSGSHSSQRMCQQYLQVPTRTPHRQQVNHKPFEQSLHSSCPHKGHLKLCSIAVSSGTATGRTQPRSNSRPSYPRLCMKLCTNTAQTGLKAPKERLTQAKNDEENVGSFMKEWRDRLVPKSSASASSATLAPKKV